MEPIVAIPPKSKWGRLGIQGIYFPHNQCPSLMRSEDEFLSLKIEDNRKIQEALNYTKETIASQMTGHVELFNSIKEQQLKFKSIEDITKVESEEEKFEDIQRENTETFERNIKDRNTLN